MKKKYESGAATAFVGRNQAIKKLQLTIADFRRLCILKGVYPVEPKNKKKVNKGSTAQKTFYYVKDINFLANEPIINKFRDFKVYVKRLKRARGRRDIKGIARIRNLKPTYKVDHIVKERYPTYTDAVRDLDDCLSLVFLFASLPKSKRVFVERVHLCQRLMLEFMHYVIASRSLRKCFISIKGYYFQADVKGQKVTWIMPHKLAYQTPDDVDFRIMSTFVEFYSIVLGFVNFKSYQDIGLIYPPKLSMSQASIDKPEEAINFNDECLASLNCDFIKLSEDAEQQAKDGAAGDVFAAEETTETPGELQEAAKLEEENLAKLKNLFKGCRFFLNREVPREQFVFAIRSFGGEVSWDKTSALGSTYQSEDQSITHHIVDRPMGTTNTTANSKQHLSRVYVQPQWIFDCINEAMLLPVGDYLPGAMLPPHLSPFVEESATGYVPPEKQRLIKMKLGLPVEDIPRAPTETKTEEEEKNPKKTDKQNKKNNKKKNKNKSANDDDEKKAGQSVESDSEEENDDGDVDEENEEDVNDMRVDLDSPDEDEEESENEDDVILPEEPELENKNDKSLLAVTRSTPKVENINMLIKKQTDEDKKLSELMIPKKNKRLYNKIMYSKKKQRQEVDKLKEKRQIHDAKVQKQISNKKA